MRYTVKERSFKIESLFSECTDILDKKGNDYSQNDFANSNFSVVGDFIGCTKYMAWGVYFYKHISAIMNFIGKGKLESEPVRERIKDAINYLAIFATMIEEESNDSENDNNNVNKDSSDSVNKNSNSKTNKEYETQIDFLGKLLIAIRNGNYNLGNVGEICFPDYCEDCFFYNMMKDVDGDAVNKCGRKIYTWARILMGEGVLVENDKGAKLIVDDIAWDRLQKRWRNERGLNKGDE